MDLEAVTKRVEERLRVHEELLNKQKQRYSAHMEWMTEQKASPSIPEKSTSPNTSPPQAVPVPRHDDLLQRSALAEQAKEAAREKRIDQEKQQMRAVPEVSQYAKSLPARTEPILVRFEKLEQSRRDTLEHERDRLAKERALPNTYHPEISAHVREMQGRPTAPEERAEIRKEKAMDQKSKRDNDDLAEMRSKPAINPRSAQLAAMLDEKEGLEDLPRHEQLLERDRLHKWALYEKMMAMEKPPIPMITAKAAALQNDDEVSARLYEDSFFAACRKREEYERRQ